MGDTIRGNIDGGGEQISVGKGNQNVSLYGDTITWREFVRRDIDTLHKELDDLKLQIRELAGRVMFLLMIVFIMFLASAVATAFTIRQFDHVIERIDDSARQLDKIESRLERQSYP